MARKRWKKKKHRVVEKKIEKPEHSNNKLILASIVILLVIVIGYSYLGSRAKTPPADAEKIQGEFVLVENKANTHEAGKVKMLEFFDFYCSHCYLLHKAMPPLKNKYGEKLEITPVGFPLRPRSFLPLEAYELALDQGKGEEMMDAIFAAIHEDKRDVSDVETLKGIAEGIGLNGQEFEEGLESGTKRSKINSNLALGNSYGLKGTPTLILDGQIKATNNSPENIDTIIKSLLEEE
ncbi:MAG: DsbA family protein [Candidatus Hydrothermarchaeales archaeon]